MEKQNKKHFVSFSLLIFKQISHKRILCVRVLVCECVFGVCV